MRAESNDKCNVIMIALCELRDKIDKFVCYSNEPADTLAVTKLKDDDCRILSIILVRAKGRLPFKRNISRIDIAVR